MTLETWLQNEWNVLAICLLFCFATLMALNIYISTNEQVNSLFEAICSSYDLNYSAAGYNGEVYCANITCVDVNYSKYVTQDCETKIILVDKKWSVD